MTEVAEFFHMGGYAWYVWPSYLLVAVVLIWNVIAPIWRRRRFLAAHHRLGEIEARRQARSQPKPGAQE